MHPINHYFAYSFSDKTKLGFFNGSSHNLFSNLIWWNKIYLKLRKKYIYNNSNFFIISPSAWLKNKIHKTKLKNKKIIIVNNGINKNIFQFKNIEEAKRLIGFNKNDKIILTIADGGKNNPRKGWKYIKKINNNLKKQNIKIISIGNKKEEIVDNIKFIKTIREPKQLEKYYQAADLLLFPTLADNFPMTSLESMACGTPVVAFDTGGIKEQIDHKINGYIAKYKDENDLLNGIKFIYSSDYEKMSKACRKKVEENFTSEIMAKKYIDLFYKAIQEYENRH